MIIGVPKEIKLQEHRIGLTPDSVKVLTDKKHKVLIQDNGGFEAVQCCRVAGRQRLVDRQLFDLR